MLHTFHAGVFCQISVFGYAAGLSEEASVLSAGVLSAGVLSAASSAGAASSATALAATLSAAESPAVARMASLTSLSASGAGSAAEAALSADSGLVSLSVRPDVPFYVSLDGEHYRKEGKEIAVRDFYQFMVDNPSAYPKTSLPSLEDFEQIFRRQAEAGRPTLCLCFTSKMSGCVGSARNARELVLEDYPDAKIEVMDSTAATVTESEMVENAVAMRDAGCTLEEAVVWLSAERVTNQIFFTVGNLDYLIKGGRIGKVTGRAANILGIKPMILFKEGEIFSGGMARGRQKSFEKALEQLMAYLDSNNANPDDYCVTVGYGYDEEEGKRLWMQTRAALLARYPGSACEVELLQIGCTIAVHTGPYALGMGVMRRWKKQN
mgnify:CR=1 FL=1